MGDIVEVPGSGTKYEELDEHDLRRLERALPRAVLLVLQRHDDVRVAGGFIRSVVAGEEVNDVDVFPARSDDAQSLADEIARTPFLVGAAPAHVLKTLNAMTVLSDPVVQVIHRWEAATPTELLDGFDFTVGAACVWWEGGRLRSLVHPRFYRDLAARRLTFISPVDGDEAGGSILRVAKFSKRGYRASAYQVARIIAAIIEEAQKKTQHGGPLSRTAMRLIREVDPSTQDGWEELQESPGGTED